MVPISIRSLTKHFGRQKVLDQVNLEIAQGELFFLLGPSGCGKTTLLRHIAGFYKPDQGQILFDGEDVSRLPPHKRSTGMMFQSYALWPHLNVAQNVAFGLEERKRPPQEIETRVAEALSAVRLEGLGTRRISQLSGGQQQRVALARALVVRPRCLLLDEPLSNLDARLRNEMRSEIRRICKESGLTAIYVTHDCDEALSMADRIAVLDNGRVAQAGTPEEIYRNPVSPMVAGFMGQTNILTGTVHARASGSTYEVKTTTGMLRARPAQAEWEPVHGEKVQLSIRPESLTFGLHLHSPNRFSGHITDTTYLGANVQYELRMADGQILKICETNPQELRGGSTGEEVQAMVLPNDIVILKGE